MRAHIWSQKQFLTQSTLLFFVRLLAQCSIVSLFSIDEDEENWTEVSALLQNDCLHFPFIKLCCCLLLAQSIVSLVCFVILKLNQSMLTVKTLFVRMFWRFFVEIFFASYLKASTEVQIDHKKNLKQKTNIEW